jgi:hydrocephalus-inducing protein
VLPHSAGDEQEITLKNPSKFSVEVYNLEFDKAYLEEEKVSEKLIIYTMYMLERL